MVDIERNQMEIHELPNGPKVILKKLPISEVYIRMVVDCGVIHESPTNNGISHLLEHLVGEDGQIRDKRVRPIYKVERAGGDFTASTSEVDTSYKLIVPRAFFGRGLRLFLNMIVEPLFSEENFRREQGVAIDEIKDGEAYLYHDILKGLLRGHPLAMPAYGTKNTVMRLTSKKIRRWHKRFYQPQRMTLVIVGNVDMKNIKRIIRRSKMYSLENRDIFVPTLCPVDINWQKKIKLDKYNYNRTIIVLPGPPAIEYDKMFYYKLLVDFLKNDNSVFSLWWNLLRRLRLYNGLSLEDDFSSTYSALLLVYFDASYKKTIDKMEKGFLAWVDRYKQDGLGRSMFLRIKNSAIRRVERDIHCGEWWAELLESAVTEGFLEHISLYVEPSHIEKSKLDQTLRSLFGGPHAVFRAFEGE